MAQRTMVRLADATGRFYDQETKFRIKLDEVKELLYPIGQATRQSLNAGGLIIVKDSPQPGAFPSDGDQFMAIETDPVVSPVEVLKEKLSHMTIQELRKYASDAGVKCSRFDKSFEIRSKILKAAK